VSGVGVRWKRSGSAGGAAESDLHVAKLRARATDNPVFRIRTTNRRLALPRSGLHAIRLAAGAHAISASPPAVRKIQPESVIGTSAGPSRKNPLMCGGKAGALGNM